MEKANLEESKSVQEEKIFSRVSFDDIGDERQEKRKEDSVKKRISGTVVIRNEQKDSKEDPQNEKNPDDEFMMGIF